MDFEDIQTLRCTLLVKAEDGAWTWSCEYGSIVMRPVDGPVWVGPLVEWTRKERVRLHAGLRGVMEQVLDRFPNVVFEVPAASVEHWTPERVGFRLVYPEASAAFWRFERSAMMGDDKGLRGLVVSLSGGGVRATAFSLGVFGVLNEVGLLPRVRCVTSVSGGALFAGAWTAARSRGMPFAAFRGHLLGFLGGERVVSAEPPGSPLLIRRYADLVSRQLFGEADGACTLGSVPTGPEVVFQATELTRAGSFVFAAASSKMKQGSPGKLELPRALAEQVRLADAVAASAAYPVGFEPFVFPDDFVLDASAKQLVHDCIQGAQDAGRWPKTVRGVPLVDGGVFDNQGVHAALNAVKRHGDAEVLLIADASVTDPEQPVWARLDPDPLARGIAGGVLAVLAALAVGAFVLPPLLSLVVVLAVITMVTLVGPSVAVHRMRSALPPDLSVAGLRTPLGFLQAVVRRARVGVVLLESVLLERIRRLSYGEIFDKRVDIEPVFVFIDNVQRAVEAKQHTASGALAVHLTSAMQDQAVAAGKVPTVLHLRGNSAERRACLEGLESAGRTATLLGLLSTFHTVRRPRSLALRSTILHLEQLLKEPSCR